MIIKSGISDPLETQIRVACRFQHLHAMDRKFLLHPIYYIQAVNAIRVLLTDMVTAITVNGSFPIPRRFNVNIDVLKPAMKRA